MSSSLQRPRPFYSTVPTHCPYLEGRIEQRVATEVTRDEDPYFLDLLTQNGFRRNQQFLYRPACPSCRACVPVRIPVRDFKWSKGFRRIWRRNEHLTANICAPQSTDEQFSLFKRYLRKRHDDGGMAEMSRADYSEMIEPGTSGTRIVEFRDENRALRGCCLIDFLPSGISGVYKFFDPTDEALSPGTFMILWMCAAAEAETLPYVYLGYWIEDCRKMAYKNRFRPLERLQGERWVRIDEASE